MQDEQHDQANNESDTTRQYEQAQISSERDQQADNQKRKKGWVGFKGIAVHKVFKQKMLDILNRGE